MTDWTIKLLYDGECPFCSREVQWLKRRDRAGQLALEDIAAPEFDPARYGLTRQQVAGVLYGVLPDGRVVSRLETFRLAYAAVGLGWLLRPTGWPILRPICDLGYTIFARYRIPLGRLFGGRGCASGSCKVG
jgi:predicted DCC family thiol-disulfide oxidoreductase YuxK